MTDQNNDCIRCEIFESGLYTQLLGVTAGLFGFFVFLLANWKNAGNDWLKLLLKGLPILVAYGLTFLTIFVWWLRKSASWWNTPNRALKYIYFMICADIVLLGFLVGLTGGLRNSIFSPIFLLIPAIATCYCSPRKGFFWWATGIIIVALSVVSIFSIQPPQGTPNASFFEGLFSFLFNFLGIGTAALCYYTTNKIRTSYCEGKIGQGVNSYCNDFYL